MKSLFYEATAEIIEDVAAEDIKNPYVVTAKFIFTDDKPNGNKQGVKYEDFPDLALSAVGMPVKLRLIGNQLGGHKASVPIGYIKNIEENKVSDTEHQLIATASLWSLEFPKEIKVLQDAYESGKSPVVSWELGYEEDQVENGVTWKRKPTAQAATFVKSGAYGNRTALIALASLSEEELTAFANQITEGGNNVDEKRETELLDEIAALKAKIVDLEPKVAVAETALKTAQAELVGKEEVIQQYQKATLISERTQKVAEAGIKLETDAEKLKTKQEFWTSLPEETFVQYIADLKAASAGAPAPKTAMASLRGPEVPKLNGTSQGPIDVPDLRKRLRDAARGISATE